MKALAVLYGFVSYIVFLASFVYAIGFVGNVSLEAAGAQLFPKTIDRGGQASAGFDALALLIDALLLGLFAVQHSVMARIWFKNWWTRFAPKTIERSTFVLLSSLILFLLYWQWRPMTDGVWSASSEAVRGVLWGLFALGWLIVLLSTFMINHWDLFGLRQVLAFASGKEPGPLAFTTRGLYAVCRHPIMLGFIIAFWATPDMSLGHLVFSIATTAYIFVALHFEEMDLARHHAEYGEYKRRTSMVIPIPRRGS